MKKARKNWIIVSFLLIVSQISYVLAQNPDYVTSAKKVDIEPSIDGDVLNDPAWEGVPTAEKFTQKAPDEGKPSTEKTVVKVMYSENFFYLSVVCYDTKSDGIIIADKRRDSPLLNSDSFMFLLDTFKDYQNGYVFGTNAAGIEYDAQITGGGEQSSLMARF